METGYKVLIISKTSNVNCDNVQPAPFEWNEYNIRVGDWRKQEATNLHH